MANSNIKPAKSIDDYGGVLPYLDATIDEHQGLNGHVFVVAVRNRVSDAAIGRMFGKDVEHPRSVNTIKNWRKRLVI